MEVKREIAKKDRMTYIVRQKERKNREQKRKGEREQYKGTVG